GKAGQAPPGTFHGEAGQRYARHTQSSQLTQRLDQQWRTLTVTIGGEDEQRMHRDVLGEEFEEKQRALVGPVQIVEDEQKRSLPSCAMQERPDGVGHMESNRVII